MKQTFWATAIFLLSLNSFAGLKCLDAFRSVINKEPTKTFEVIRKHDRYWRYRKYNNGEVFVETKDKLFQELDFWSQVGERDIRLRELRKKQARSLVEETVKLDRPEMSVIILRPIFSKIQISYFKMQRNNLVFEKLISARNLLFEGKKDSALKLIEELKTKYRVKDKLGSSSLSEKAIIGNIDRVLTKIENDNIDITIDFARKYAEYTETYEALSALASKNGKLKEKAQKVLDLLSPIEMMLEQFEHYDHFPPINHVTKDMLREVVVNNRISEIVYLKKELRLEKWTSIVSRLSVTQLYELTDMIVKKFPWLNTPSIRSQIRYTVDNKEILTHYPNIDRMIADGNSPKVMWEYLLNLDARDRTTDSLIRTFSRRIDTRAEWRSVKEFGAQRAEKLRAQGHQFDLEVRLYDRMIEMEKSVMGLPPLAPWHRSGNTKFVRFILDGILLGSFAYGSYYFLGDLIPDSTEENKELTDVKPDSAPSSTETVEASSTTNPAAGTSATANLNKEIGNDSVKIDAVIEEIDRFATEACGSLSSCPQLPN